MNPANDTPQDWGYRWPAEWEHHRATWLVWPHNPATWPGRFSQAREQFGQFLRAVARFEPVELLAVGAARDHAATALADVTNCRIHEVPTNDSWIRDHGPTFLNGPPDAPPLLLDWQYNAWGGKYPPFDLDNQVPRHLAQLTGRQRLQLPLVLEGGAIEGNGAGVVLTTASCLLNPNRNPQRSQAEVETFLRDNLGADDVIWLTGDLPGDDTDGHIDQLARFVGPQTVVLLDRPDSDIYSENRRRLLGWAQHHGSRLEIIPLQAPAPRQVDGMWLPASYANFYLVNGAVLVPVFRDPADEAALRQFESCFPDREIVPVASDDLVFGLGSLHCLSQQEPAAH